MKQYKTLDGLFFAPSDRARLAPRVTPAFRKALADALTVEDAKPYPRLDFSWYAYNEDIDHALSYENYQNINGVVSPALSGMARKAYLQTLACLLLGRTDYIPSIREIMLRFPREYPLHLFVMADMGLILYSFLNSYLFVLDAMRSEFSEDEQWTLDSFARSAIMDTLYEQNEWLTSRIGKQHCNNHLVAHSYVALAGGLYYGRRDWVKYGLENPEGIYAYLEDGMSDPGVGIEGSFTYNLFTCAMLLSAARVLRRAGSEIDLYHRINARGVSMKAYFVEAFQFLSPAGRVLPLGDTYARPAYYADMDALWEAALAYKDDADGESRALLWAASRGDPDAPSLNLARLALTPTGGVAPQAVSRLYEKYGAAILKSREGAAYWGDEALCLAMRTGNGVIHGNCDHLAIQLFGRGAYLIRDFEALDKTSKHVFSANVTRTLNRARLAHSAVMADGRSTRALPSILPATMTRGDGFVSVCAADEDGLLYEGVKQSRTLKLYADALEDEYVVSADAEHDFDYLVHIYDDARPVRFGACPDAVRALYPNQPTYETLDWMRDVETAPCDGHVEAQWRADETIVRLTLDAPGAILAARFTLPDADDFSGGGTRSLLVRVRGASAVFRARYEFIKAK